MLRMKKPLLLNRTILFIVMVGYCAFLVLMLFMDWYLIRKYQEERQSAERGALSSYIDTVQNAMEKIDRQLSEIYRSNEDFSALQKEMDPIKEYSISYDLRENLYSSMFVDETLNGFYVFYNGLEKSLFQADRKKIDPDNAVAIRKMLQSLLGNGNVKRWFCLHVDEEVYLALNFERENVAIIGILSLQNIDTNFRENIGKNLEVILSDAGNVLKNKALAEEIDLRQMTSSYTDRFEGRSKGYRIYGMRVPNTEMWIYTAYRLSIWSTMTIWQLILLILTGLSILAVAVMYRFLQKQIVMPLRHLVSRMNDIREGRQLEEDSKVYCFYELSEAGRTLSEMVQELKKQKLLVYEEIIEKQKAQMQYLQLQLQPHFYLNGLKMLNVLALDKDTEKMQDLIMNLSVHLRYLLQAEREMISIHKELEFIENYICMQKHLSGRPVVCEIDCDTEVRRWNIPVMAVFTFVENSIKYARLGNSQIPLEIQVTARRLQTDTDLFLDLMIQDNGQGYSEEILKEINGDIVIGNQNIGINNLKRRCLILYGHKVEFCFDNDEGAFSELIIPERVKENEDIIG